MPPNITVAMSSSTKSRHRWLHAGILTVAKRIHKSGRKLGYTLGKILQKLNVPRSWIMVAGIQTLIVLLLLLSFPQSSDTVTLSVLLSESEARLWEPLINEFQRKNPDIRIASNLADRTTDDIEAIYTADLQQPTPAHDLIYVDMIWVQQFAKSGQLKDLTGLMPKSELDKFLPEDLKVGQYQNKQYWLPLRSDVGVLYYRDDLLQAAGYTNPPQTFQELLDMSRNIQSLGLADWGYVWQGRQYEGLVAFFEEVLEGYGGFWIQPDTNEVGLDQPEALEAVKFLQRTIQEGISPGEVKSYNEDSSFNKFAEGDTIFLRNWPFIQPRLAETPTLRNRVKIAPTIYAPGQTSTPCKGGWGFSIAKNARHPEAAWRAIQFFTSEASQRQLVLRSGFLPSRKSLFTDRILLQKFPYLSSLYTAVENSVSRPPIPPYEAASEILQRHLRDALDVPLNEPTANDKVEALMKAAADETRTLLSEMENSRV